MEAWPRGCGVIGVTRSPALALSLEGIPCMGHWDSMLCMNGGQGICMNACRGHLLSIHIPLSCRTSVQSLSHVQLFATPWTAARQASLSITNSRSLLKLMSIESVIPSNHLILCRPLLLLPSIFPSVSVFSNESVLHIR